MKIKKKGLGGGVGLGGQGGCERRSKVFVKIQKKKKLGGGCVGRGRGESGGGGPIRGWGGGGGGSKFWGRWAMWGIGDVNQE